MGAQEENSLSTPLADWANRSPRASSTDYANPSPETACDTSPSQCACEDEPSSPKRARLLREGECLSGEAPLL